MTNMESEMVPRQVQDQGSDVVWSGDAWICSKELKHYPAFSKDGVAINLYSFAYVMGEDEIQSVAYLDDMYEDKQGNKKVKVRWFHHYQEVKDRVPQLNVHPEEVFITPSEKVISAEFIVGGAVVLTPKDYEKYLKLHPESSSSRVHMCHREIRNNKLNLFSLSKMRGYGNQPALSHHVPQKAVNAAKSNEEVRNCIQKDPERQDAQKARSLKGNQRDQIAKCELTHQKLKSNEEVGNCSQKDLERQDAQKGKSLKGNQRDQIAKCELTHQKLRIKLSSQGDAIGIRLVGPEKQCQSSFKVGDNVEFLSQDSGMRGCWFRCKILKASQKRLKVQYYDIDDVDGPGKIEEWVPASRLAGPDQLGMRHAGRLTIRPWPLEDFSDYAVQIGLAIDVWWSDGWWEGVIIGVNVSARESIQVYFPGESRMLQFEKINTRISRDWIDNKWVEIKANHDIFSSLSLILSEKTNQPASLRSAFGDGKIISSLKVGASRDGTQLEPLDRQKSVEGLNGKKKLSMSTTDGEEKLHGGSGGSGNGNGNGNGNGV